MVFERIVVDVLNRYLGDFIENLDSKQLSIGVWGGDVVLTNLILKQSALDDLDLPLQTVFGRIGKLTLKIPWKDPYNSPIEASVDGLFLLTKPNTEVKYNAEKEEKVKIQAKQAELLRIEQAKEREKLKDKAKADPGFIEKLSAQIVKNIQIYIRNIHIRYEDSQTYPGTFFAAGITLGSLIVVTTNSAWEPGIVADTSRIYKILDLEGLAVYWNCNTTSFTDVSDKLEAFQNDIATKANVPSGYNYILGPINSSAKLIINQKPELDKPAFTSPKVQMTLEMEKLAVGISKEQYQTIIALADSMDRMNKGVPFRKFRPCVPYKGNYREWWQFAYKCIMESEVKRKKDNWDWLHMLHHRTSCREYGDLYQKKLQTKKLPVDTKDKLEQLECQLDLVNLVIIRRKIELEYERTEVKEKEKSSWFSGWFWSSSSSDANKADSTDILKEFENAMTPAEKQRLYHAIDYQENSAAVEYPEEYVATSCKFMLYLLEIDVKDDSLLRPVITARLKNVYCEVDLRPAASALKVLANINQFSVDGFEQDNGIPKLISSNLEGAEQLLSVVFETNPLGKKCGQFVQFSSKPLNIIYDAITVNNALEIFKVPESSALEQLSEATAQSLNNVKQMTATGLQYAIEKHTSLELNVDIHAPYIIIPYGGQYTGNENVLVLNLGHLRVTTLPRDDSANVKALYKEGCDDSAILQSMIEQSYDNFNIDFTDLQMVLAQSGEDWMSCLEKSQESPMHILNPLSLKISLQKCVITDDPRLPLMKVKGELPSISINIVNAKLIQIMSLIGSIPFPKSEPAPVIEKDIILRDTVSTKVNAPNVKKKSATSLPPEEIMQFTTMQLEFIMKELCIHLMNQEFSYSECQKVSTFKIQCLEVQLLQKTFMMTAGVKLKSIEMSQFIPEEVQMLHTKHTSEIDSYLINIQYTQVDKISPDFHTLYKSCESSIFAHFANLTLILHLEGLKSIMQYATDLQAQLEEVKESSTSLRAVVSAKSSQITRTISSLSVALIEESKKKAQKQTITDTEEVQLMIDTKMDNFTVKFITRNANVSSISLRGLIMKMTVKDAYTKVETDLCNITVVDLNEKTLYKEILSVVDKEAIKAVVVMNNLDKYDMPNANDISVFLQLGQIRIVFLNYFISNMLSFLNEFQTAQQAIIEASQEATKQAAAQVQAAFEKETKIALNVNMKAPDILVPASSQSRDALWLDLGHITLKNSFRDLFISNEAGNSGVMEEITIVLTDLKLMRALLKDQCEIENEEALLNPFTWTLFVKRNLSVAWYKDIPAFELNLNMPELSLTISQLDYKIILSVLGDNFAEGAKAEEAAVATKSSNKLAQKSTFSAITIDTVETADIVNQDAHSDVSTFLNFNVTMERIVINICASGLDDGIGKFYLEGISAKGKILTNDTKAVSLLLVNCVIEDTRKSKSKKLNQLMERKPDVDSSSSSVKAPVKSMLDIICQQKGNNTFVDMKVYSFNLILSMDFLLALNEFFSNAIPAQTESVKPIDLKSKSVSKTVVQEEAAQGNMTLHLKVEQPDIILVENMDSIDTKAMILNSEIMLKMCSGSDKQMISGSIKDFALYTCCYNPAKRAETKSYVLYPVNISISGAAPEQSGTHMEVCITQVKLSISPAIIELLSRCHSTMIGYNPTEEAKVAEIDHSELWTPGSFKDSEYWFLKPDVALEANETIDYSIQESTGPVLKELCIVRLPSLIITIETGSNNNTLPMLFLESSFQVNINNWSSQMGMEAMFNLQMAYYNSRLALWEPLIEPVQIKKDNEIYFKPWQLKFEVSMAEIEEATTPGDESIQSTFPSAMTIDISSKNNLELTVTKTCLEVLNNLSAAFATAMQPEEKKVEQLSPYKFKNDSGLEITLLLDKGDFNLLADSNSSNVILESGTEANLQISPNAKLRSAVNLSTELETINKSEERFIDVMINDFNSKISLPIVRADTRYYSLKGSHKEVGLVCEIEVVSGVRIITLRTIIQVQNTFNIPIEVYFMTDRGNELELIEIIKPNATLNLPFKSVYTNSNEIFFSVNGFTVTRIPFVWKELQSKVQLSKLLFCEAKTPSVCQDPFIIKACGETKQIFYENTSRFTILSTNYIIKLGPAVVLKNCLPVDVICCFETTVDQHQITPGQITALPNIDPEKSSFVLRIPDYLEKEWSCTIQLSNASSNLSVWTFQSNDSAAKMFLDLGMNIMNNKGFLVYSIYCPFWMINKTGLLLSYRASDENLNILHHPPTFKGPILFSFNAKNFFGKKKASIRIENGEWSDKFSLDVAGSSGVVVCKHNNAIYQIGVHNQLTYNGLSKQVMFTPYFMLLNNSPFTIQCQESERPADPWIDVVPSGCSPFWPRSDQEDKLIILRVEDTDEISVPFLITESHTTLLRLNNKYGGVNVDIQMIEGAVYINFTKYEEGTAPAIILNHTNHTLSFWEKDTVQIRKLKPNHRVLYTWSNPSGQRVLVWDIGKNKDMEDELKKDGVGQFSPKQDETVYWVSFLNGMQRVLLFTLESSIAEEAQSASKFERIDREINLSIHGIGVSLVNNVTRTELMYLSVTSTGIIWQQCKTSGKRFKQMNAKDSNAIENSYQSYLSNRLLQDDVNSTYTVDGKIEVDFEQGLMLKPRKRMIKRTFETGLWIQMKTSPHQMQLHGKINRIQIDNQMYDCIFPVVLAPVPPPKSVAISNVHKPFVELSIVQLLIKNTQIRQFKYFKVLIQEFHVKVDLNFINALLEVLQTSEELPDAERERFLKDVNLVNEPLFAHASLQSQQEQKSFYDLLHFSPLKMHVSFTLPPGQISAPNFVTVLLQGLGVTLTNLQDVVFKLGYFERNYSFLTQKQLTSEATQHYVGQAVKQLYVLVLGLDVLGNPYGLVLGITKGVEDLFYEPIQGAIQGPGEFAEGLVLGVRSLFGRTVGGTAGAVSRITGAMGKGIAALTFDKDYQRKRRDQINRKPASVQEGFARGGKGLVMGVVDGVTGVFTKPISGAKEQGVGGFFKGLGKGAVGLVTRPTAGVIDFTSGSLDAVKRATEMSTEATRIRPSRFCQADGLVRPYNVREAEGHKLLTELDKGKYATTDIYAFHYEVIEKKEILLLTDKRLAYITHNDIFGGWQTEWSYTWQELQSNPVISQKGLLIPSSDAKKKKIGLFGSSDNGKLVLISDSRMQQEICEKIEDLRSKAVSLL